MRRVIFLTLSMFAGFLLVLAPLAQASEAQVDKPAPGFTLPYSNGKSHSLSDYKGKIVVLEWLNHGCPYVKKHYNSGQMQKLQKTYAKKGVVWLSIISSAPGKQGYVTAEQGNEQIKKKKAAPAALLLDPEGDVGKPADNLNIHSPPQHIEATDLERGSGVGDVDHTQAGFAVGDKGEATAHLDGTDIAWGIEASELDRLGGVRHVDHTHACVPYGDVGQLAHDVDVQSPA